MSCPLVFAIRYVLPNHYVFQLAERPPADVAALFGVFQGVPPLVRTHAAELLAVIRKACQSAVSDEEAVLDTDIRMHDGSMLHERTELPLDHVRVAGRSVAGLWDRLQRERAFLLQPGPTDEHFSECGIGGAANCSNLEHALRCGVY